MEIEPENPNALAFSALNKIQLQDIEKAKEQIDLALKSGEQAFLLFIAGKVRYLLKNFEDAKTYLIKSFESDPTNDCQNLLGLCYFELGNYGQANNIFLNLLEKSPMNINLILNSAKCFEKLGDINSALQQLEKAVEVFPDCEEAHELIRKLS